MCTSNAVISCTGYLHVWLNAKQCNANYCNALDVVKAYHAKYMQHVYEMDGFQGLVDEWTENQMDESLLYG